MEKKVIGWKLNGETFDSLEDAVWEYPCNGTVSGCTSCPIAEAALEKRYSGRMTPSRCIMVENNVKRGVMTMDELIELVGQIGITPVYEQETEPVAESREIIGWKNADGETWDGAAEAVIDYDCGGLDIGCEDCPLAPENSGLECKCVSLFRYATDEQLVELLGKVGITPIYKDQQETENQLATPGYIPGATIKGWFDLKREVKYGSLRAAVHSVDCQDRYCDECVLSSNNNGYDCSCVALADECFGCPPEKQVELMRTIGFVPIYEANAGESPAVVVKDNDSADSDDILQVGIALHEQIEQELDSIVEYEGREYRKVHRVAQPGELIMLNGDDLFGFDSVGDVLKADCVNGVVASVKHKNHAAANEHWRSEDEYTDPEYLWNYLHKGYDVLEPIKDFDEFRDELPTGLHYEEDDDFDYEESECSEDEEAPSATERKWHYEVMLRDGEILQTVRPVTAISGSEMGKMTVLFCDELDDALALIPTDMIRSIVMVEE